MDFLKLAPEASSDYSNIWSRMDILNVSICLLSSETKMVL
jgi:hypothetical protein